MEDMDIVHILGLDIFGLMVPLVRLMKVHSQKSNRLNVGDNYVISQQTARACLKYMVERRDLPPSARYLSRTATSSIVVHSVEDCKKSEIHLMIVEERARRAITHLGTQVQNGTPWKDLNMDCVAVSRAHIDVFLVRSFTETLSSISDTSVRTTLTKLYNLFALNTLTKTTGALVLDQILTPTQAKLVAHAYTEAVMQLSPQEAVQITDCFEYTDYELGSVLGRYDGKVYETLWEEVQKDPVNSDIGLRNEAVKMMKGGWKYQSKL